MKDEKGKRIEEYKGKRGVILRKASLHGELRWIMLIKLPANIPFYSDNPKKAHKNIM